MNTDIVIVGAGPAGIFTAIEMIRRGSKKHITIVEKGQPIEKRRCPKTVTKHCVNCRPYCHITTGFSGAGAFSDGKLSLSHEVGGDFPTLIGAQTMEINGQPLPIRASMGMLTQPISFLGLPVVTVPLRTANGQPIGLQLIAAPFNEQACLRAARALEEMGITDARPVEIAA